MLPLPVGGQAGLLQADPNQMPFEAMKHKEQQMVALGAKLVEVKLVQKTATEANYDHAGEVSVLSTCAQNVFLGYKAALEFAGQFVGAETTSIEYELTEPLNLQPFTADQMTALMGLKVAGLIDFEEARFYLKKSGLAYKDDDEVKENVAADGFDMLPPPALPGQPPVPPKPAAPPKPGANPPPPAPKPKPAAK
jgi:hypothetical protein